jgi:hypothetical protein
VTENSSYNFQYNFENCQSAILYQDGSFAQMNSTFRQLPIGSQLKNAQIRLIDKVMMTLRPDLGPAKKKKIDLGGFHPARSICKAHIGR